MHALASPYRGAPSDRLAATTTAMDRLLGLWGGHPGGRDSSIEELTTSMLSVARSYRLSPHDAEEVVQTTWLRLLEQAHHIRKPGALGGWVKTTTRRECLKLLQRQSWTQAVDPEKLENSLHAPPADVRPEIVELEAVRREHRLRDAVEALPQAIESLSERQRAVMRMLALVPMPSYKDVARELDMPLGSIGPTRARCFERLRRSPHFASFAGGGLSL